MKNTFGNSISVTVFGESHGDLIGATLDGIAPGIKIDSDYIEWELKKRRPHGKISTARVEKDNYSIISGVKNGVTTGTPITVIIPNENKKSEDYESIAFIPRPGHADLAAYYKYHGYEDRRGGGHFSGRITAPIVLLGAIAKKALEDKGIYIGTHIRSLHGIADRVFISLSDDIRTLSSSLFPVLSDEAKRLMEQEIELARAEGDSVGGVLETAVIGFPAGIGEPFFDSLESVISHAMLSIPGIKGIEFGLGFGFGYAMGSEANDGIQVNGEEISLMTNNNGGINGGISNGAPIMFSLAVKPTPSISKAQRSVDISKMENTDISVAGRHDPAIIHRVRAVVDSLLAITLCDAVTCRYGTDFLK